MLSHTRNVLAFVSPTVNNTGELKCAVGDGESDDGRSIFIAVGKFLSRITITL